MIVSWQAMLLAASFGAIIGSFVTTAALRATEGRTALGGRSSCDTCSSSLSLVQTIPIYSYLRRRGRCDVCDSDISVVHPFGELAGALAAVSLVWAWPISLWLSAAAIVAALLYVAVFDAKTQTIPDLATASILLGVGTYTVQQGQVLSRLITGLAVFGVMFGLRAVFKLARGRTGLGFGDVKLIAVLAMWVGPFLTPWAVALSGALGLGWLALRQDMRPSRATAFGPFLACGFWTIAIIGMRS